MDNYDGGSHEANVLHAALGGDDADVKQGVSEMTRFEKRCLFRAANSIAAACSRALEEENDSDESRRM